MPCLFLKVFFYRVRPYLNDAALYLRMTERSREGEGSESSKQQSRKLLTLTLAV
jgi:hypothetical protein